MTEDDEVREAKGMRIGDLAAELADRLAREHVGEFEAEQKALADQEGPMQREERKGIFSKIEFRWRASDQAILEKIRPAADRVFWACFEGSIAVLDNFYSTLRVPVVQTIGEHQVVMKDAMGRVMYEKDPQTGLEIEDWGQLNGQDLDKCIIDLSRLQLAIAPQLNELLNEAVFAKHIADDKYYEAYLELLDDTIPGRTAYASRQSRVDKYHAFFRWYLYSNAESFMKELRNVLFRLEKVRDWRVRSQRG